LTTIVVSACAPTALAMANAVNRRKRNMVSFPAADATLDSRSALAKP
jgi:hypothetical protein